jgi:hypothetical protein
MKVVGILDMQRINVYADTKEQVVKGFSNECRFRPKLTQADARSSANRQFRALGMCSLLIPVPFILHLTPVRRSFKSAGAAYAAYRLTERFSVTVVVCWMEPTAPVTLTV